MTPKGVISPGVISIAVLLAFAAGGSVSLRSASQQAAPSTGAGPTGVREAAWAPDSKRLAASWFDAIWTMTPEGKDAKRVVTSPTDFTVERDPAWSPDGQSIAFSAEQKGEFDIWIAPAKGGTARRITSMVKRPIQIAGARNTRRQPSTYAPITPIARRSGGGDGVMLAPLLAVYRLRVRPARNSTGEGVR